jgi:poly(3-hydroxybutyrate) depolymerase
MLHVIRILTAMCWFLAIGHAHALPTLPTVAGKSHHALPVLATGQVRNFALSVPVGFEACYAANTCTFHQFPLIIALHGRGQTSSKALSWFESGTAGNVNYLTAKDAFFVAPQSLPIQWRQIGPAALVTDPASYDDVQYIKELVDYIVGDYQPAIDPHRVYLFGFSSGAGLIFHMLCFQHHQFRSFAAISQGLQWESPHCGVGADNSATATPEQQDVYLGFPLAQKYGLSNGARAKPLIYMHGTSDNNLANNDPAATVMQLVALNNTVTVPTDVSHYLDAPTNIPYTTLHQYFKVPGSQGRALVYYDIHYGDHSVSSLNAKGPTSCIPGTSQASGTCAHNTDYSAVDEVWAFWNAVAGLNLP